jgi:hypothetical protein
MRLKTAPINVDRLVNFAASPTDFNQEYAEGQRPPANCCIGARGVASPRRGGFGGSAALG